MSTLQIEVVTPLGIIFTDAANSCTAPGVDGEFQILPNHAAMVSNLNIGIIRFDISGGNRYMATSGGFLEVKSNELNIIVETAEWAEDINLERASVAADRAKKSIKDREGIDLKIAEFALLRALNRIHAASRI
jgi:F-type H+-transporting ATPase subunit epsilon